MIEILLLDDKNNKNSVTSRKAGWTERSERSGDLQGSGAVGIYFPTKYGSNRKAHKAMLKLRWLSDRHIGFGGCWLWRF